MANPGTLQCIRAKCGSVSRCGGFAGAATSESPQTRAKRSTPIPLFSGFSPAFAGFRQTRTYRGDRGWRAWACEIPCGVGGSVGDLPSRLRWRAQHAANGGATSGSGTSRAISARLMPGPSPAYRRLRHAATPKPAALASPSPAEGGTATPRTKWLNDARAQHTPPFRPKPTVSGPWTRRPSTRASLAATTTRVSPPERGSATSISFPKERLGPKTTTLLSFVNQ